MIEIYREDSMSFKVSNNGDNSLDCFKGIMRKLDSEARKKGFRNIFNTEEREFITEFSKNLFGNENIS